MKLKAVNAMNIDKVLELLKDKAEKHPNDSRQIIKHKSNVLYGNQYEIVLSNIDNSIFEVFLTAVINGEVISQINYCTFKNIEEATNYYNKFEKYIINLDLESIVDEIQKTI